MRIRSIKPEFWRSDDVNAMKIEDRLLFIGLWSYVDDNGVGIDRHSDICADLFAHDLSVSPHDTLMRTHEGLKRLHALGVINRYEVGGKNFIEIVNWAKHQKINRPSPGRFPRSDACDAVIHEALTEDSLRTHEDSCPGAVEQWSSGAEEQKNTRSTSKLDERFSEFYDPYPRHQGRGQALKAWRAACKKTDPDTIIAGLQAQLPVMAQTDKQFIPLPATWLNGERWADEISTPDTGGLRGSHVVNLDDPANLKVKSND